MISVFIIIHVSGYETILSSISFLPLNMTSGIHCVLQPLGLEYRNAKQKKNVAMVPLKITKNLFLCEKKRK